jgi:hypothetical protein
MAKKIAAITIALVLGSGGGIWLAMLDHRTALSFGVESSTEGTLLQAGTAFGF